MSGSFTAQGPTILVVAAVSAPTGVQALGSVGSPSPQCYRISNAGLTNVYVASGQNAAAATAAAVIPTTTPQRVYVINSGDSLVVNDMREAFWSAATAQDTASVFITPGYMN